MVNYTVPNYREIKMIFDVFPKNILLKPEHCIKILEIFACETVKFCVLYSNVTQAGIEVAHHSSALSPKCQKSVEIRTYTQLYDYNSLCRMFSVLGKFAWRHNKSVRIHNTPSPAPATHFHFPKICSE